jgi:hypothetical protein
VLVALCDVESEVQVPDDGNESWFDAVREGKRECLRGSTVTNFPEVRWYKWFAVTCQAKAVGMTAV